MARLELLLFSVLLIVPLSIADVSLLRIEGSIVSAVSSGMVVAYTGRLHAALSNKLNRGGDALFGDTGGESSWRPRS
jgi:hypothetical protein